MVIGLGAIVAVVIIVVIVLARAQGLKRPGRRVRLDHHSRQSSPAQAP